MRSGRSISTSKVEREVATACTRRNSTRRDLTRSSLIRLSFVQVSRQLSSALLLSAWLSMQAGCSALFVNGVPNDYAERENYTCTTNRPVAGVDLLFSTGFATVGAGLYAALTSFGGASTQALTTAVVVTGLPAIAFGASSVHGFVAASDCEDAMDDLNERFLRTRGAAAATPTAAIATTTIVPAAPATPLAPATTATPSESSTDAPPDTPPLPATPDAPRVEAPP